MSENIISLDSADKLKNVGKSENLTVSNNVDKVQWGLVFDCTLNKCKTPHEDDGRIVQILDHAPVQAWNFSHHRTHVVKRTVKYVEGEWASV